MGTWIPPAVLAAALAAAGCVTIDTGEPLDPAAPLPPGSACVYGRFERVDGWRSLLFYVLLEYEDRLGRPCFAIEARGDREVRALRCPPGEYRLARVLLATSFLGLGMQTETDVRRIPVRPEDLPPLSLPFALGPGEALYLGDFRVAVIQARCGPAAWLSARIEGVEDRFDEATDLLLRKHPALGEPPAKRAWDSPAPAPWPAPGEASPR